MSVLLVQRNVGIVEMIVSAIIHKKQFKGKKDYAEKFSESTSLEIQSPHWGGNRQLSMEGIDVEYFPTSVYIDKNVVKYELNSYICNDNEWDAYNSHTFMVDLLNFFIFRNISFWYVNSMGIHWWLCKAI